MPTISGVTGTVSTGQTLTISGSSLINESLTNATSFFTDATWGTKRRQFEGAANTALETATGTDSPFNVGWDTPGGGSPSANQDLEGGHGFLNTSIKLRGSSSVKFHSIEGSAINNCGNGTGVSYGISNSIGSLGSPQEYWGRLYYRFGSGGTYPNCYSKFIYNNTDFYIDFNGNSGSPFKQWLLSHEATSGGLTQNYYVNAFSDASNIVEGRWYCIEWHFRAATAGTADGAFELYQNGQQLYSKDGSGMASSGNLELLLIGTINANNTLAGTSWDFETYKDEILTRSGNNRVYPLNKVEISDNSTYGAGTLVWQHPVSLDDSTTQVECDLTGLGAGPYYLFVTDHQQNVSSAFNLSGGALPNPSGGLPALVFL